jgi:hypothetical protein
MKTIKFREYEFKVKDTRLDVKNACVPLLYKFNQLKEFYYEDIDISIRDEYNDKLTEKEVALNQLREKPELTDEDNTYIATLENAINELTEQMNKDIEIQKLNLKEQEALTYIIAELITDKKLMQGIFQKTLIGNTAKIDFDSDEYESFASEIVTGFFLILMKNKRE